MKTITHNYFGELDFNIQDVDVIWEKEMAGFEILLWTEPNVDITEDSLDKCANFIENYQSKIQEGREALRDYLENDGEYMNFHIEELELEHLPNNVPDFVEKMTVTNIALWLTKIDEEFGITIDFKISPEESDEILCVKFNLDGDIEKISWES